MLKFIMRAIGYLKLKPKMKKKQEKKAEQMFDDIPDNELIANLEDVSIDDCWEDWEDI